MTQKELAKRIECAEITIRKIDANPLRPSRGLAKSLLATLRVTGADRIRLLERARHK